ncbi:MAG: hypothetical protein ACE5GK_08400 [Nitrospiria bacterium]
MVLNSHAAVAEKPMGANTVGEIALIRDRLNQHFDELNQNIRNEASHYSDYILYGKNHSLHDFWQHLGQLKQEQGKLSQGIELLQARIIRKSPGTDDSYPTIVDLPPSGALRSDPGLHSKIFSQWRFFYFLISGGFFLINLALFLACIEVESSRYSHEHLIPHRKAA